MFLIARSCVCWMQAPKPSFRCYTCILSSSSSSLSSAVTQEHSLQSARVSTCLSWRQSEHLQHPISLFVAISMRRCCCNINCYCMLHFKPQHVMIARQGAPRVACYLEHKIFLIFTYENMSFNQTHSRPASVQKDDQWDRKAVHVHSALSVPLHSTHLSPGPRVRAAGSKVKSKRRAVSNHVSRVGLSLHCSLATSGAEGTDLYQRG